MFRVFKLTIIFLLICMNAFAQTISLVWDNNEDADYYIVYWGRESLTYTNNSEEIYSPICNYDVKNLDDGIFFFAVKAFNECGNSSDFSDEVSNTGETTIYKVEGCFLILNAIYL